MELKHKLSDHCESLLQTETSKMTQNQAGALDFVEKIDNLRLVIRHAFSNGRTMLAILLLSVYFGLSAMALKQFILILGKILKEYFYIVWNIKKYPKMKIDIF